MITKRKTTDAVKGDHKRRRKTAGRDLSMTRKLLRFTVMTSAMFMSVNGMERGDNPKKTLDPIQQSEDEANDEQLRQMILKECPEEVINRMTCEEIEKEGSDYVRRFKVELGDKAVEVVHFHLKPDWEAKMEQTVLYKENENNKQVFKDQRKYLEETYGARFSEINGPDSVILSVGSSSTQVYVNPKHYPEDAKTADSFQFGALLQDAQWEKKHDREFDRFNSFMTDLQNLHEEIYGGRKFKFALLINAIGFAPQAQSVKNEQGQEQETEPAHALVHNRLIPFIGLGLSKTQKIESVMGRTLKCGLFDVTISEAGEDGARIDVVEHSKTTNHSQRHTFCTSKSKKPSLLERTLNEGLSFELGSGLEFTKDRIRMGKSPILHTKLDYPNFKGCGKVMERLGSTLMNHVDPRAIMIENRAKPLWTREKAQRLDNTFTDVLQRGEVEGFACPELAAVKHALEALSSMQNKPVVVDIGGNSHKIHAKSKKWQVNHKYKANTKFKEVTDKWDEAKYNELMKEQLKLVVYDVLSSRCPDKCDPIQPDESYLPLLDTEKILIGQTGKVRQSFVENWQTKKESQ